MSQSTFFKKFTNAMDEKVIPIASKIANQPHLLAVRNGMIAAIPLTIVGGACLIVAFPPIDPTRATGGGIFTQMLLAWHGWAQAHMAAIMVPYATTMGLMALFVAMAVGYSLAGHYKLNQLSASILSTVTFLLVASPAETMVMLSKITDGMEAKAITKLGVGAMPTNFLDAKGLFTALIVGLVSVEVMRFLKQRNIIIKMPDGVPPTVASSFESLIPLFVNLGLFYTVSLLIQSSADMLLPGAIMKALVPAMNAVDSPGGVFILSTLAQLLWFCGLHGASIVNGIQQAFFDGNTLMNAADKVAGNPLVHFYTNPMWHYCITLGGSGATMALVLMMLRSRSAHLKSVGNIALAPAIFNINEPIIFGAPLVLNPLMAIPFIFVQGINGVIAWTVTKMGIVSPAFIIPPWTTPAPIGMFLSTLDWRAIVLVLSLIALDYFLYLPFFKMYEKSLVQQEGATEEVDVSSGGIKA